MNVNNNNIQAYHEYKVPDDSDDICAVCHDSLSEDQVVAHEGEGEKHPIHKLCARKWSIISATCPTCSVEIDTDSIVTPCQRLASKIDGSISIQWALCAAAASYTCGDSITPRVLYNALEAGGLGTLVSLLARLGLASEDSFHRNLSIGSGLIGGFFAVGGFAATALMGCDYVGKWASEATGIWWIRPIVAASMPLTVDAVAILAKSILNRL